MYIEITDTNINEKVIVNINNILYVVKTRDTCCIHLVGIEDGIRTKESYSIIKKKLSGRL